MAYGCITNHSEISGFRQRQVVIAQGCEDCLEHRLGCAFHAVWPQLTQLQGHRHWESHVWQLASASIFLHVIVHHPADETGILTHWSRSRVSRGQSKRHKISQGFTSGACKTSLPCISVSGIIIICPRRLRLPEVGNRHHKVTLQGHRCTHRLAGICAHILQSATGTQYAVSVSVFPLEVHRVALGTQLWSLHDLSLHPHFEVLSAPS